MKGKIISKILVVLLALLMLVPIGAYAVSAAEASAQAEKGYSFGGIYYRSPAEQKNYDKLINKINRKDKLGKYREYLSSKKPITSQVSSGLSAISENLPDLINSFKDSEDTAGKHEAVFSLLSGIASCCGPYGQLAASIIDLGNTLIKLAMGGEEATSEMAQMEDRLTQQLDEIQSQLSEIEEEINALSNEINASTDRIIGEVTVAIDDAAAKEKLDAFMTVSGSTDFGYRQYGNYIYGTNTTAYYTKLKTAIADGSSEAIDRKSVV